MASIQTVAPVIGEFTALPFPEYIPCCDILFQSLTSLFMALRALLFYKVIMLARSQLLEDLIFKLFPSKETITSLSIGKNSVYLPE